MKTICPLALETAVSQEVTGPHYLFTPANQFIRAVGKEHLFNVQFVEEKRKVRLQDGVYSVTTDLLLEDADQADLIILPPIFGDMRKAVQLNEATLPWIVHQYKDGVKIASLCVSAFLLASTVR